MRVTLQRPHPAQVQILESRKRFNHLRCGRRFGKTSLITELSIIALEGNFVGIWFPTYKDLSEVWKELKHTYRDVITQKNEQLKQLIFINGGIVDFWSMEDPESGQGRKYHRAIIDEAAKAAKLEYAWEYTIRPTLTDYQGDGYIMSRPKGTNNGFCRIEERYKEFNNWAFFHFTSYDNPHISDSEIDEAKEQLPPEVFQQEYMAEYIDPTVNPFFYNFEEHHIMDCGEVNSNLPVYLSFDFNVDPATCLVSQFTNDYYYHIDEFRIRNATTYDLCEQVKSKYGHYHLIATGDATGGSRKSSAHQTDWQIIKQVLNLTDGQLSQRIRRNPPISESRTLSNVILARHPEHKIDPRCEWLIDDMRFVQVKEDGSIDKGKDARRTHLLDCKRYADWTWFRHWVPKL